MQITPIHLLTNARKGFDRRFDEDRKRPGAEDRQPA